MITLSTLITIWGLYSIYKIYQHNRKIGTPFDIGTFLKLLFMKKCQDCRANNRNMYCDLEYKTEKLSQMVLGYEYEYISPLEKCDKPKSYKDYHKKLKILFEQRLCKDSQ